MTVVEKSGPPKAIKRRKSAVERKAEIVEMTIQLAAEFGPDRLTAEILARKIGISQAAIFRHFENKSAIWEAVARRLGEKIRQGWDSDAAEYDEAFGSIKRLVLSHLTTIQNTPALPAILFSRELHVENEKLRVFFVNMIKAFLAQLTALISAEYEKSDVKQILDPEDAASLILALVQGLALRWSLNGNSYDLVGEGERLLDIQISCIFIHNQKVV